MTTRSEPIRGEIFPATKKGFALLLLAANRAYHDGFSLLTIVRLEDAIAGVFVERPPRVGDNFFE